MSLLVQKSSLYLLKITKNGVVKQAVPGAQNLLCIYLSTQGLIRKVTTSKINLIDSTLRPLPLFVRNTIYNDLKIHQKLLAAGHGLFKSLTWSKVIITIKSSDVTIIILIVLY